MKDKYFIAIIDKIVDYVVDLLKTNVLTEKSFKALVDYLDALDDAEEKRIKALINQNEIKNKD